MRTRMTQLCRSGFIVALATFGSTMSLIAFGFLGIGPVGVQAQMTVDQKIANAMSAAPESLSGVAMIRDWDDTVLRDGSTGWVCLPDFPATEANDPMCLDGPWQVWWEAFMAQRDPEVDRMGFGYMLGGEGPGSNLDPFAAGPTPENEWLPQGVPHVMIIVPDARWLEGIPTHPSTTGPWVMWRDTPYAHIMVPMPEGEGSGS